MNPNRYALLCLLLLLFYFAGYTQTDTVTVANHRLQTKLLRDGRMRYLVYMEDSATGIQSRVSVWERNITHAQWHNQQVIAVTQRWTGADSLHMVRLLTSYCDAHSFLPLYHHTFLSYADGRKRTEAFDFLPGTITAPAADTVNNKGFSLMLKQPTFNWELDMETFSMLPLARGKIFTINFYHPGGTVEPKFYDYTVDNEEQLESIQGKKIDCWKLTCHYDAANYSSWWIDKNTHAVVKMKERFNGHFRYKLLLLV